MRLMELNWQKSRYLKIITADECTRSEVMVGVVNATIPLKCCHSCSLLLPLTLNL